MLEQLGGKVVDFRAFPDHHLYTTEELGELYDAATTHRCDLVVTTTKDFVRIFRRINWSAKLLALGIETDFGNEQQAFDDYIENCLSA
jgi:tetraacyldisaccharide 4'-kinase